jgi:hypothetical protein
MKMRFTWAVAVLAVALAVPGEGFAQSSGGKKERHFGRIIGTIGGAVGGLALGWAISDDDVPEATRKAVRNMALCAAAGGVGGYFLGRAVDKHIACVPRPDSLTIRQAHSRAADAIVDELGKALRSAKLRSEPDLESR